MSLKIRGDYSSDNSLIIFNNINTKLFTNKILQL